MDDECEQGSENLIFICNDVLIKSHASNKTNVDFVNNFGTLSVVEYKSELGKCIEWHQCDVLIESDDQEWTIVKDTKSQNGTPNGCSKNSKTPFIRIPFKNLINFFVSDNKNQIVLAHLGDISLTEFNFQNGHANYFCDILKKYSNTPVLNQNLNPYTDRDQKEIQVLKQSFAELDLFSDDTTRVHAIWSFIKRLHDNPYETTLDAFSKVTNTFLNRLPNPEFYAEAEDFSKSLTSDEFSHEDFHGKASEEEYELVNKGTPLPPRTFPPRSSLPFSLDQWQTHFDDNGRIIKPEVIKEKIFHGGISSEEGLRSEVWKFLLGYYPWDSTFSEREELIKQKYKEYFTMKQQWKTMTPTQEDNFTGFKERKSLIEKDVCRTDRKMEFFAGDNNTNLEKLQDILMTYVMYNFDLGYVQGMNDLLSPLLIFLKDEVETFWCFSGFMEKMIRNFDLDQAGMKKQFQQLYCILRYVEPEFASYLEHQDSNNMTFCFRWLLIWFKREFIYNEILQLWEILWTGLPCKNFHLLICAAILDTEKETIMSKNFGFTEILKHINELANRIDLNKTLTKAEGIYIQISSAAKIPAAVREIIGMEPLPEDETNEDDEKNESSKNKKEISSSKNAALEQSSPNLAFDYPELAFDDAISLQYL